MTPAIGDAKPADTYGGDKIEASNIVGPTEFSKAGPVDNKLKEFLEATGINTLREDVDNIKININYLAEKFQEMINSINASTKVTNDSTQKNNDDKLAQIKQIAEIAKDFGFFKGEQSSSPLLGDDWIKEEIVSTVKEQFAMGHDINRAIKKALTGRTAGGLMKEVLTADHEPE